MEADQSRRRVIAFMNQKGGVGKTTTAVNLGAALAELGAEVMLIDLDPQAHMTLHVGIDPDSLDASMYDLLTDPQLSPLEISCKVDDRLSLLPAEVNVAGVEVELASIPDRQSILKRKVESIVGNFDYVLIDCPPSLGMLTINALVLADEVIVPIQPHFLALQGFSKLTETLGMVKQQLNPDLRLAGVVLCMFDAQTRLAGEVLDDVKAFFEQARGTDEPWSDAVVFAPPIRRNIKLAECPGFRQTIFQYEPWCAGARDYRRLAEAFMQNDNSGRADQPSGDQPDG
jgi:chromosome partitioning protein